MTDQPGLFALAARMGIAAEYQDNRDHTRHAEAAVVGVPHDLKGQGIYSMPLALRPRCSVIRKVRWMPSMTPTGLSRCRR